MTALEEINKHLEGRDIATLTSVELVTEISRLLSTLESLQAKNEGLLKRAATAEKRLRGANTAFERERKLHLKNQELNRKFEARAEAAEAEVTRVTESRDGYKRGRDSIQAEYDRLRASHSDEIEALTDKIEGLSADLDSAVGVAFNRGAHEWVRMNYPDRFEKLSSPSPASTGGEHNAE